MLSCTTGDLLRSDAEALVNTVNCEGYMGKGLAYQFKRQFPHVNDDYVAACKRGDLRPGRVRWFQEKGKIVINFPTKDKWREKSKLSYIESGLDDLVDVIRDLDIKSIAIPPLGCGNGGLDWFIVREVISSKLETTSQTVDIVLYEPRKHPLQLLGPEPQLDFTALVLMDLKQRLNKFTQLRLQEAAFFTDLLARKKYFNFSLSGSGVRDSSVEATSRAIREFQCFHNLSSTEEARGIIYGRLASESVDNALKNLSLPSEKACDLVNAAKTNQELKRLACICFLIEQFQPLSLEDLAVEYENIAGLQDCDADRDITASMKKLCEYGLLEENLLGYSLLRECPSE